MNFKQKTIFNRTIHYPLYLLVLTLFIYLFIFSGKTQASCYPDDENQAGTDDCYYFDMHLHYVNFVLETQGLDLLKQEMNKNNIQKTLLFGLGYALTWDANRQDRKIYYFDKNDDLSKEKNFLIGSDKIPPLYFSKEGDYIVIEDYKKFTNSDSPTDVVFAEKVYPFLQAIDPTDKNEIYYVIEMFEKYPEFCGIGEVLFHKGAMNRTAYKQPYANSSALDPVLDFAAVNKLPFLFHQNIGDETYNSTSSNYVEPVYMDETMEMIWRHPNNIFIWAHTGISRYLYPGSVEDHIRRLEMLLQLAPENLHFDISWFVWDSYIEANIEKWRELIELFPHRFMIGSDKIGNFVKGAPLYANEREFLSSQTMVSGQGDEILKYNLLLSVLKEETAHLVAHGNIERILNGVDRGCKSNLRDFIHPWKLDDDENRWTGVTNPWDYEKYKNFPKYFVEVDNSTTGFQEDIEVEYSFNINDILHYTSEQYYRWDAILTPTGEFEELKDSSPGGTENAYQVTMFEEPFFDTLTSSDDQLGSIMVGDEGGLFKARQIPYQDSDPIMYPGGSWSGLNYWMKNEGNPTQVNVPYGHQIIAFSDKYYQNKIGILNASWQNPWQSLPEGTRSLLLSRDKSWADKVWYAETIYNGAAAVEVFADVKYIEYTDDGRVIKQHEKQEKVVKVAKVDPAFEGVQTIVKTRVPYILRGMTSLGENPDYVEIKWWPEFHVRCKGECGGSVTVYYIDQTNNNIKTPQTFTLNDQDFSPLTEWSGNRAVDYYPHGKSLNMDKKTLDNADKKLIFGLEADVDTKDFYIESIALQTERKVKLSGILVTASDVITETGHCAGKVHEVIIDSVPDLTLIKEKIGGYIRCIEFYKDSAVQFFSGHNFSLGLLDMLSCGSNFVTVVEDINGEPVNVSDDKCALILDVEIAERAKSLEIVPEFSITVFEDEHYQGAYKTFEIKDGNFSEYSAPDWGFGDNEISSVLFNSDEVEAVLYKNPGFDGDSEEFINNAGLLGKFDNQTSSLVVMKKPRVDSDKIRVFKDNYYGGNAQVYSVDIDILTGTSIGSDAISAFTVGDDIQAFLCADNDFTGDCRWASGENEPEMLNNNSDLGDRVNSIKILDQDQFEIHNMNGGNMVKIYSDSGFEGTKDIISMAKYEKYKSISYLPDVGFANDSLTSIAFGDEVTVYLFEAINFKGRYVRLLHSEINLAKLNFSDITSSILVVRKDSVTAFVKENNQNGKNMSYGKFSIFFPGLDPVEIVDQDDDGYHDFRVDMDEVFFDMVFKDTLAGAAARYLKRDCLLWEIPNWFNCGGQPRRAYCGRPGNHCIFNLKKWWKPGGSDPGVYSCNSWADIRFNDHHHDGRLKLKVGTSYYTNDADGIIWLNLCGLGPEIKVTFLRTGTPPLHIVPGLEDDGYILKLDFNDVDYASPSDTEDYYTSFTLDNSGSSINDVKITIAGNVVDRRRTGPTGITNEKIYRDLIFAYGNMTIILEDEGLEEEAGLEPYTEYEITIAAFDIGSHIDCDREALWEANDQPLFHTSFCGTTDRYPETQGQYFYTGRVSTTSRSMLTLKARMSATTGHTNIYAFANSLTIRKVNDLAVAY